MSSHSAIAQSGGGEKPREISEGPRLSNSSVDGPPPEKNNDDGEVFHDVEGGVSYRTLGWIRASVIFMKVQFALGVLGIPVAFNSLGAVGGSLSVIGWGLLNYWVSLVQGDFRDRHAGCHSVADMAGVVGGKVAKELTGILFIIGFVLCGGSGMVALSTGLNALSHHGACTVYWTLISAVCIASGASFRRFHTISWITWAGFISVFTAVLIVVIAVTLQDRPAIAPATGPYDLGYKIIGYPNFSDGITATATIFLAGSGSAGYIPVISEMKNPKDYKKALGLSATIVNGAYLAFSLIVYKYCGQWVASPSLGSAGQTIKMVSYGVALIGLVASGVVFLHTAAKYTFVRILRNSPHLQNGSWVHWTVWLSCTIGGSAISFILAESIPIFNYILALTGSICFAPLGLMLPAWLWLYDFSDSRKQGFRGLMAWLFHVFVLLLGIFLCIGGTYATSVSIRDAYASGEISSSFSCADNSNSS